jgi:hypothetical protein
VHHLSHDVPRPATLTNFADGRFGAWWRVIKLGQTVEGLDGDGRGHRGAGGIDRYAVSTTCVVNIVKCSGVEPRR